MERLTINGIEKLRDISIELREFPTTRIYEVKDVGSIPGMYMLDLEGYITMNIYRQLYRYDQAQLWVRLELAYTKMVHKPIGYSVLEYGKMVSMDRFIEGLRGIEWIPLEIGWKS